jgi:hypothetical protein
MLCFPRIRVWALLLAGTMLAHPAAVRAARIDISDPTALGPVLLSLNIGQAPTSESLISEVRFAAGIYSYVYAIQTSPYFPFSFEGEPNLLSFSVTGHPLGGTWGAINSSDSFWGGFGAPTNNVADIAPIYNGFQVVPGFNGAGSFTVVYRQSSILPALNGMLTYNARNYEVDVSSGERTYIYDSFSDGPMIVPTPEPGSIVLFGLGLAAFEVRRRTRRNRLNHPGR